MCFTQYRLIYSVYNIFHILLIAYFIHLTFVCSSQTKFQQPYIVSDFKDIDTAKKSMKLSQKVNISNYLWYLFQNRNQNSHQMHKPILYYTPKANTDNDSMTLTVLNTSSTFSAKTKLQNHNDFQTSESVNIFRRIKDNQQDLRQESFSNLITLKEMLYQSQLNAFRDKIPSIPNERPFHNHVLLNHNEMMRLLGRQNFDNEFMSFNKPWEAINYPSGRLISSDIMKEGGELFETESNLHKDMRFRKLTPNNYPSSSDIYNYHYKRKRNRRNNQVGFRSILIQNAMRRLKLIQNLRDEERPQERLVFLGSERSQISDKQSKKNQKLRRLLREFLRDYTSCPLYNMWYDWGPRFWPRWIKAGKCVNLGNISCSLPPGMYCHEKGIKDIIILRYICPEKWPVSSCNWYRIHLPIVTECSCGCTDKIKHKHNS
ncbi:unnamed protein product [Heterobilharzia americana]|nr:unnamed protein product [Heterobilharzia americana]CAH8617839.1 unnamed protein product [Heterobilharzia americana]